MLLDIVQVLRTALITPRGGELITAREPAPVRTLGVFAVFLFTMI